MSIGGIVAVMDKRYRLKRKEPVTGDVPNASSEPENTASEGLPETEATENQSRKASDNVGGQGSEA